MYMHGSICYVDLSISVWQESIFIQKKNIWDRTEPCTYLWYLGINLYIVTYDYWNYATLFIQEIQHLKFFYRFIVCKTFSLAEETIHKASVKAFNFYNSIILELHSLIQTNVACFWLCH